MYKRRFAREEAQPSHGGLALPMFYGGPETEPYIRTAWYILKKGMCIEPHKNSYREMFIFTKGRGFMRVGEEVSEVEEGEAVYVPPHMVHTLWNEANADFEFVWIGFGFEGEERRN